MENGQQLMLRLDPSKSSTRLSGSNSDNTVSYYVEVGMLVNDRIRYCGMACKEEQDAIDRTTLMMKLTGEKDYPIFSVIMFKRIDGKAVGRPLHWSSDRAKRMMQARQ